MLLIYLTYIQQLTSMFIQHRYQADMYRYTYIYCTEMYITDPTLVWVKVQALTVVSVFVPYSSTLSHGSPTHHTNQHTCTGLAKQPRLLHNPLKQWWRLQARSVITRADRSILWGDKDHGTCQWRRVGRCMRELKARFGTVIYVTFIHYRKILNLSFVYLRKSIPVF